jgi:valyl-tRNA synthetase
MHPLMPFVTEEIYSYVPGARGSLAVRRFPQADERLLDQQAERDMQLVIEATRRLRNLRDSIGVPAAVRLAARVTAGDDHARSVYERALRTIERLARFELELAAGGDVDGAGAAIAVPGGTVHLLRSDAVDPEEAKRRLAVRADALRSEIERARGKLANKGFVEKAPAPVVQEEREKLARYERELSELGG